MAFDIIDGEEFIEIGTHAGHQQKIVSLPIMVSGRLHNKYPEDRKNRSCLVFSYEGEKILKYVNQFAEGIVVEQLEAKYSVSGDGDFGASLTEKLGRQAHKLRELLDYFFDSGVRVFLLQLGLEQLSDRAGVHMGG